MVLPRDDIKISPEAVSLIDTMKQQYAKRLLERAFRLARMRGRAAINSADVFYAEHQLSGQEKPQDEHRGSNTGSKKVK